MPTSGLNPNTDKDINILNTNEIQIQMVALRCTHIREIIKRKWKVGNWK